MSEASDNEYFSVERMSKSVNPEVFAALWEMAKEPLDNSDSSYQNDETLLDQIGPWEKLETISPVPAESVYDSKSLASFLDWWSYKYEDDSDETLAERIRQIEQGAPLTEEERSEWVDSQWPYLLDTEGYITFYSCEYETRKLYWAVYFTHHSSDCYFGPFRSLEDAYSTVKCMDWLDYDRLVAD